MAVGKDEYYYFSPFIYRFYSLFFPLSQIDDSIYMTIQDDHSKTTYFDFSSKNVSNDIAPLFSGDV